MPETNKKGASSNPYRSRGTVRAAGKKSASKKTAVKKTTSSSKTRTKEEIPSARRLSGTVVKLRSRVSAAVRKEPVIVIAGEHSGDLLGGDIVARLKSMGYATFFGTGGNRMAEQGVELIRNVEAMTVVGFVEALKAYRSLKSLADQLTDMAVARGVKTAILIDYPGFNLRFGAMLKKKGIRVIHVVSPQIWAWKYGRIKQIRQVVDLMLVLYHFEKDIYDKEGVNAKFIGHPLTVKIPERLKKEPVVEPFNGITVGLLPGSRRSEVMRLLKPMLEAAELLREKYEAIRFLLPGVNPRVREYIQTQIAAHPNLNIEYRENCSLRVMKSSNLVILSSGTATLETTWFSRPMIILYKVGFLNFLIASIVIRIRFIGLPNILAKKGIIQELLQSEVNPRNIFQEAVRILDDNKYSGTMIRELSQVKSSLGDEDPSELAAKYIDAHIAHDLARSAIPGKS